MYASNHDLLLHENISEFIIQITPVAIILCLNYITKDTKLYRTPIITVVSVTLNPLMGMVMLPPQYHRNPVKM